MLHGTPCAVTTARSTPKYAAAHSCSTKCPPGRSSPVASSIAAMRHSHGPRPSSQSWRLPSHRSMSPAWALRSRRRRCFGGRRRRTAGTPPARSTRRTVRTETRIGGCSSASFSVKCASLKSRYFVRRKRRSRFRTAARSLFTGTCPALPCRSPARPARSTARRTRRTCRTESWSTRAASCSVSFPAPNRATASHRFHCHSAISSILLHGREGGQNRWPLEGGQNRCPSTLLQVLVDRPLPLELVAQIAAEHLDVARLVHGLRAGVVLGVDPRHGADQLRGDDQRALLAVQELRELERDLRVAEPVLLSRRQPLVGRVADERVDDVGDDAALGIDVGVPRQLRRPVPLVALRLLVEVAQPLLHAAVVPGVAGVERGEDGLQLLVEAAELVDGARGGVVHHAPR